MQYRVCLNTTADGASTVSAWLDGWVHKRGARGCATHRRDAIIIYVRKRDPSLQDVLDALAVYQAENSALFVDERVRLTRPAVAEVDSTTHDLYVGLRGPRAATSSSCGVTTRSVSSERAPTPPLKPPNLQKT